MSRIGVIVRRLYGEELKSAANNGTGTTPNNGTGTTDERPSRKRRKFVVFKKALSNLGNRRRVVWIIRIAVILAALVVVAEAVFQFNRFAAWSTKVMARRADFERELQRRENLIPNLVYAVSRYAAYEQGVFKYVSDARETLKMIRSSETPGIEASSILEKALSRLVALAEEYPDLKATQSIQDLIRETANTEDRIADAKETYNETCEIYNQYLSIFPGNVFAFIYRYKPLPYIGLEEELKVPVLDLNMTMTEREGSIEEDVEFPTKNLNMTEGAEE